MIYRLLLLALTGSLIAAPPDQVDRWKKAELRPAWQTAADKLIVRYGRYADIYERLEKARATGVPAQFIFGFHERESSGSFAHHLHEGSSLRARTKYVPKGRPKDGSPPFEWYPSALDALYDYERLERRDWKNMQSALQAAESYNGLGYQSRGLISPYLWSGTNLYSGRGKFTSDGKYDPWGVEAQIGVCAILKRMEQRGIPLPLAFRNSEPKPEPVEPVRVPIAFAPPKVTLPVPEPSPVVPVPEPPRAEKPADPKPEPKPATLWLKWFIDLF